MTTPTGPVGRLMKFTALPGRGADLAELLLRVAEALDGFPGCLLYTIGRDERRPDEVHVTEVWRTAADADAALASSAEATGTPSPSEVLALVAGPPERTELAVLGGVLPGTGAGTEG
ncbi:putative quinol monooxygenase [Streptomyces sp. NPDC088923]|uniref:putative quinol monooxygenase n=1 Tax=Streptomyces sp. NPDC088923 TaxID=3365913 RepID=UPI003822C165